VEPPAPGQVRLVNADWLDAARALPPASIDLMYADPPFNTGRRRTASPRARVLGRDGTAAYDDAWPTMADYVSWLRERIAATLPALTPGANVLIHCDARCCHHLRLLLDELLGPERFVNHLIWSYGLGGSSPRAFARKHDDILFYCIDPGARYFRAPRVPATSARMRGLTKKSTDVLDIPSLNNMSRERTGYPTQKPLALLSLLVEACCPPGGSVLDPCCGSGTALVAAAASGRGAIGFDRSAEAIAAASARLAPGALLR